MVQHSSLSPPRNVLLYFWNGSWNLQDAPTFNVSCTLHQYWNTSYFINDALTWNWFFANTEAIGMYFKHGSMCSSLRSWFLYLHRDGFVLTSKKEQAVYLDAAKATRKGMVKQEWNTRVGCVQFSPDKLQTYRNGSTTYSLRQNPLDNCWMRPRRCQHT